LRRKRRLLGIAALAAVAGLVLFAATARSSTESRSLRLGIFDDAHILGGDPGTVFPELTALHVRLIRVTLWWGGTIGVASGSRPASPRDPADPAYDWSRYDSVVRAAAASGIQVMFTILGSPAWASGSPAWNRAPKVAADLQAFAAAAARRYDGTFAPAGATVLPEVRYWTAWNEPNNPVFLRPQYVRSGGGWVIQSARDYARICNAVVTGIKSDEVAKPLVACGVTAPRGNNQAGSARASVSPLVFLRAMRSAGARGFDAYAHNPYYGAPAETPTTPPPLGPSGQASTAVTLGNFGFLVREVTRLYGPLRIWITEYGYQTNPPDRAFGVSWAKQALYLRQAFDTARANPRVDMFLWFLLQDEAPLARWQSGLVTVAGKHKPAFAVFARLG
jgi:hypothetical protein